ncbi:MAG: hypothetical protein KDK71_07775 [Chlamydiia bacterium]|nr:hypothetical protein [Chlamydiia bacterium]
MRRLLLVLLVPLFSFAQNIVEPYVVADFLYWKVKQEGPTLAASGFGTPLDPVNGKGKGYLLDFDGKVGFRVGLGMAIAHDGWDFFLGYTQIHGDGARNVEGNIGDPVPIRPSWDVANGGYVSELTKAEGNWDFQGHIFDLEWGRKLCLSSFMTFRPFFGLKGFINASDYTMSLAGAVNDPILGTHRIDLTQDFWGIGIRFGFNTNFYLTKNWSVFGNFAASDCWSRFTSKRHDTATMSVIANPFDLIHTVFKDHTMVPIIELSTGVSWEMGVSDDLFRVLLRAGWEEQIWWNTNRFIQAAQHDEGKGNLLFQGLTVRFRFDF